MIYELRMYNVAHGRMGELVERFNKHTLRLFDRHGISPVLFLGIKEDNPNIFSYVVSFADTKAQIESWKSFLEDKERIAIWNQSNKNGNLVISIDSINFNSSDLQASI